MTDSDPPSPYQRFLATRADYLARERAATEQAERASMLGAAGALALSVAFLEKIAPHPVPGTRILLGLGWSSLLLSLGASLVTFLVRSKGYRHARESLDVVGPHGVPDRVTVESLNRWLRHLLHVRVWSLLLGVVLLVLFAFANVPT